jgi:hypothetical protein
MINNNRSGKCFHNSTTTITECDEGYKRYKCDVNLLFLIYLYSEFSTASATAAAKVADV